jgi:protein associated with RNAse G/E
VQCAECGRLIPPGMARRLPWNLPGSVPACLVCARRANARLFAGCNPPPPFYLTGGYAPAHVGQDVDVEVYKYDGSLHRVFPLTVRSWSPWAVSLYMKPGRRVREGNGRTWTPADRGQSLHWLYWEQWFNVVAYSRHRPEAYYCNLALPPVWDGRRITYVDMDLDLRVRWDGSCQLVDQHEFRVHQRRFGYPDPVVRQVHAAAQQLMRWASAGQGPFARVQAR